jgi:quinol monooxygenase YgiN
MIVIAGTLSVDPARRDAFVDHTAKIVGDSRSEPGCVDYAFSADPLDPSLVRVVEVWDDAPSLDAHRRAAHHSAFLATFAEFGVQGSNVTEYEIARSTYLSPR